MRLSNRVFPYPVLNADTNDYRTSVFQAGIQKELDQEQNIRFTFLVNCTNPQLNKLIQEGKATYLVHIENSRNNFRKVYKFKKDEFVIKIPLKELKGKIEMVAGIATLDSIKNYMDPDWDEDFQNVKFNFQKGQILAFHEYPDMELIKEYEEFKNPVSVFSIVKKNEFSEEESGFKGMDINLNDDRIKILVSPELYDSYSRIKNISSIERILHSAIILPALLETYYYIYDDIELYRDKKWFISLVEAHRKRGIDLEDEILNLDNSLLILAQKSLEYIFYDGLLDLERIIKMETENISDED